VNLAGFVRDVTDDDFEEEVIARSYEVPVVVDFWAAWCGPCRILGPVLERLANEANGKFVLAKIDVDRSPRHAQAFGVRGIPTVIAFRNGERVGEFSGAIPEPSVRDFLRSIVPSEADALVLQAEAVRGTDRAKAEALYRDALSREPENPAAAIGLAEILVERREFEEASKLVGSILATGPLADRVARLQSEIKLRALRPKATEEELRRRIAEASERAPLLLELGKLLASEERFSDALEALLQAAAADRKLAEGEVKDLMVEIFHAIGVRSPLADEYRTKLTRLLY
jgi:putative thioredoxin